MIIATGVISILAIGAYFYFRDKPQEFPVIDPSHPVYDQAQRRANQMQRTYVVLYNQYTKGLSVKEQKDVWPSDEDTVVAVVHPRPNKKELKLVYSK
jgi:hypothetical protein